MSLHVRLTLKDSTAGVMATLHGPDPMHFSGVFKEFFAQRTLEGATLVEAGHWLAVWQDVVCLHVSLKRPALAEALTTGGARIAATVNATFCLIGMHADKVAADCVPLHSGVLTQVATVDLFTRLTESMYAQFALAGEVTLAGGTLETGVRKM